MKIGALKIIDGVVSFKRKLLASEAFRIAVVVFSVIALVLLLMPFFLDHSALRFQIEKKINQISGANITIHGDVSVSFLPTPSINVGDVVLRDYKHRNSKEKSEKIYNIYAKSVQLKLTIFKFIEDPIIRKIVLKDVVMENYQDKNKSGERNNPFTKATAELRKPSKFGSKDVSSELSARLFSVDAADPAEFTIFNSPVIVIKNGEIVSYDRFSKKSEVKAINTNIHVNKKRFYANGEFNSDNVVSKFNLSIKFNSDSNNPSSVLEINSPAMELRARGNFTSGNKGLIASDFYAEVDLQILELKSFYNSYVNSNGVVAHKLKYSNQPIKISANIANEAGLISISDIFINSDLISGKGSADLSLLKSAPIVDVNLDLENLDLDKLWSNEATPEVDESEIGTVQMIANDVAESIPFKTNENAGDESKLIESDLAEIPASAPSNFRLVGGVKNVDLTAEIKIKNIQYLNGEIKDADLYLSVSNSGEVLIQPMIFKIPGEGMFRVNGVLDNSLRFPKFVGKFDVEGKSLKDVLQWLKIESKNLKFDNIKEYSIYSDVLLFPNRMNLSNFYLNLNKGGSELLGNIDINSARKVAKITSDFRVDQFNIDDYFLTSGRNDYLSPGLLVRKMLWLNDISSYSDLKFRFNKLLYKGEEFPDQSLALKFRQGYLKISDLNLKSDETELKANFLIDISGKKPRLEIDLEANKFHYESPKIANDKEFESEVKPQNFFGRIFALPSLEGLSGKISLKFNNLNIDGMQVENTVFSGKLDDGKMKDAELLSDLYGGNLKYNGFVALKSNKTISGNLLLNTIRLNPFLTDSLNIKNISGLANVSASLVSSAYNVDEFKTNLSGEVKFNANRPTVSGYGLNDLVKKMFNPKNHGADLQNLESILDNPDALTIFDQASGSLILKGREGGNLVAKVSAPALNGVLTGEIDSTKNNLDALFNVLFLTGTRQKQISINIASNVKGSFGSLEQSSNLDQAKEYLGIKEIKKKEEIQESVLNSGNLENEDFEPMQEMEIPKSEQIQKIMTR